MEGAMWGIEGESGTGTGKMGKFSKGDKTHRKAKSLIYRHPELFANFLIVVSKLMSNNKHVEKLFASIFLKNIYFMETVQQFAKFSFSVSFVPAALAVLDFFRTTLRIY